MPAALALARARSPRCRRSRWPPPTRVIDLAVELPLADGLAAERAAFYDLFDTDDQKEGMRAFLEKRPPAWRGR